MMQQHQQNPDDYYGDNGRMVGPRRALEMAAYRPESDYSYVAQQGNRAGFGAGHSADQGGYVSYPTNVPDYGAYPSPRGPYQNQMNQPHVYSDQFDSNSPHALSPPAHAATRQLVGRPPAAPPMTMPMGRPAVPQSDSDFARLQQYGDLPGSGPFGDEKEIPYTPHTAGTMAEWGGDARQPAPQRPTRPGDELRRHTPPTQDQPDHSASPERMPRVISPQVPLPIAKDVRTPPRIAIPAQSSLPSFEPMSPIRMSTFEMRRESRPLTMYEDESTQQKRIYGEVASAAGVVEPTTPKLNASTSTRRSDTGNTTTSSFSAHEMTPRLPSLHLEPPAPYIHGQPLSPLTEVETPRSGMSKVTSTTKDGIPSSTTMTKDKNPFERTLVAARQNIGPGQPPSTSSSMNSLAPPFDHGPAFPSPAFPPPSPGGMSVPGSVTDSPRRWSGGVGSRSEAAESRGVSMFYGEDAYGGI